MEVVQNKASGKFFVVLDDAGDGYLLLITPEGKIKRLEQRLFGPLVTADYEDAKWQNLLAREQIDLYEDYE